MNHENCFNTLKSLIRWKWKPATAWHLRLPLTSRLWVYPLIWALVFTTIGSLLPTTWASYWAVVAWRSRTLSKLGQLIDGLKSLWMTNPGHDPETKFHMLKTKTDKDIQQLHQPARSMNFGQSHQHYLPSHRIGHLESCAARGGSVCCPSDLLRSIEGLVQPNPIRSQSWRFMAKQIDTLSWRTSILGPKRFWDPKMSWTFDGGTDALEMFLPRLDILGPLGMGRSLSNLRDSAGFHDMILESCEGKQWCLGNMLVMLVMLYENKQTRRQAETNSRSQASPWWRRESPAAPPVVTGIMAVLRK